jgi:hypothetical protein
MLLHGNHFQHHINRRENDMARLVDIDNDKFWDILFDEACVEGNQAKRIEKELDKIANDGWIPCSERLPELRKDCLVTVKYSGFLGMYGTWVKVGHMESENDWFGDCIGGEVVAWQPLPAPYKPKGEK